MNRRDFLKAGATAAMFSVLAPFSEIVTVAEAAAARSEPLRLVNVNTKEAYDLELFMAGQWNPNAIMVCDFLMRDWRQNKTVACDRRIYAGLYVMQHFFGKDQRIQIHSGFRTPETNLILKEQGYNPAVNSQHIHAKAVDFSLPGASVADIAKVAYASKSGGVGCYKKMGFVHWDFRGEQVKWGDSFL
jgi:uncharacterized protein YcbK (DUF882 family)